jgi:hypothetical protein
MPCDRLTASTRAGASRNSRPASSRRGASGMRGFRPRRQKSLTSTLGYLSWRPAAISRSSRRPMKICVRAASTVCPGLGPWASRPGGGRRQEPHQMRGEER